MRGLTTGQSIHARVPPSGLRQWSLTPGRCRWCADNGNQAVTLTANALPPEALVAFHLKPILDNSADHFLPGGQVTFDPAQVINCVDQLVLKAQRYGLLVGWNC